jgi:exonuclease III
MLEFAAAATTKWTFTTMASTVKLFLGFVFMLLSFIPVHVDHFISCQNSDNFNAMNYFPSNTELQNFRYIPNVKGNNSPLFLRDMLQHYSNTDSNNLFLYKEKPPLVVFSEGIGRPQGSKYLQLRFLSFYLCFYLVLALDKSLNIYMFQRQLLCRKFIYVLHCRRKIRRSLALCKHMQQVYLKIFLLSLLLLSGNVHPNPGPPPRRARGVYSLITASWNVRTLLDTKRAYARPSAIVARELDRYNIDIAALSETRVLGETSFAENYEGGGYTFFLMGKPEGEKCYHGVGFAIRSRLLPSLQNKHPTGINERLMTMSLPLDSCTLTIISAYAPTLARPLEEKECFYDTLNETIKAVPSSHKLLLMGDFNARVGVDYMSWANVLGKHGVGLENSNGTLLLSLCAQNELIVTNTIFQQANKHKTTWMHPGTKKWHMIDFIITRQRDVKDVHHTRAMCGSCTWSDHRLVKCKLNLRVKVPRHTSRLKPVQKLNTDRLKSTETRERLATKLHDAYETMDRPPTGTSAAENWDIFKSTTFKVAEDVLGSPDRKHRDWFNENDPLIKPLLTNLHDLHLQAIEDRSNTILNAAYRTCKQQAQKSLRAMQDSWWKARALDLQKAADKHDYKAFYQGLKAVYGPRSKASSAVKSKDGVLLKESAQIRGRWAEHFEGVLNQASNFDMSILDEIPQRDINMRLATLPTLEEVILSIKQITSGKAPGPDGIPPDVFKHGGLATAEKLHILFTQIWEEGEVPQDFKDADMIHLYKNKGDIKCCDNHRGISLLCIAGKIFARLILNRLFDHADNLGIIPESQCGFYPGRGTTDMNFAIRLLQEKCRLYSKDLYLLFIDLTKAFDTIDRQALWAILEKIGCPRHFVGLIRSFHDGMQVTVREGSEKSTPFEVTSGTKQGCVLAPTLFSIFFSLMLHVAFKDATDGVDIKSRFDRGLFNANSTHFEAVSKVTLLTIRELLFADDCALAACSEETLQQLCDCFATAARRFGLTISINKTEAMYQPAPGNLYVAPVITIDGNPLKAVEHFKYLGSIVSNDASMDAEITARIAKATSAFGRLIKRLWTNRGVRLDTKISVYKATVLTSLMYGCETWTLNKQQINRLEKFHQSSLRKIARIRWFHKVTNYEVLSRCKIHSLQSMLEKAKLRWTGHVIRMDNGRIPKALLYGRLATGVPRRGNHNTYSNSVKRTLRACDLDYTCLEELASERDDWRDTLKEGILKAEGDRIGHLVDRRMRRKARAGLAGSPTRV